MLLELAKHGFAKKLGCTWNGSEMVLKFTNGSVLQLGYCDSLSDTSRYQGTSWGLLLVDELTLLLPGCVEILRETLRSGDEGKSVIGIRSSCNPGGPSHTTIKVNYVEATDNGKNVIVDSHGRTVRYIPSRVFDNPHVGKDYVRTLEAIPDVARRKAMLDGDWSAFGGQFFSEWSRTGTSCPEMPSHWPWAGDAGALLTGDGAPLSVHCGEPLIMTVGGGFFVSCIKPFSHLLSRRPASWPPSARPAKR